MKYRYLVVVMRLIAVMFLLYMFGWNFSSTSFNNRKTTDSVQQFNLGVRHYKGIRTRQDYKKAKEFFEQAAQQGYTKAQFNLGTMCEKGQGVSQDYHKAKKYYKQAAEQGYRPATDALARLKNRTS